MKKILAYSKTHKILTSVIALIVIGSVVFFIVKNNKGNTSETLTLAPKDFVQEVAIAGKVIPAKDVELAFETSGKISRVNALEGTHVSSGQILASLSSADIMADRAKAQADLEAEVAKLAGYRNNSNTVGEVYSAKKSLVESIQNAFTKSDDAIRNKVDAFYTDPRKANAEILPIFESFALRDELNARRVEMEGMLTAWEKSIESLTIDTYSSTKLAEAKKNLATTKSFLDRISIAVNAFKVYEGAATQTEINMYKSDVSTSRTNINAAISAVSDSEEKVRSVESQIPYQEAKIKSAEAVIASYNAQLGKTVIHAPFSGVVSRQDAKVGEIVGANTPVITLISSSNYEVEAFVPEVSIKDVKIGNIAKVTLDAFDDKEVFMARIISIDTAETVRDGVSTYKVTFVFEKNDTRLKSGMTANAIIATANKKDSLLVPPTSLITRNGATYVQVLIGNGKTTTEKLVTTGSVASTGEVEILAGVSSGEKIILNPEK